MKHIIAGVLVGWLLAGPGALLQPDLAHAQTDGISYTFSPSYNLLQWSDELGIEDTELFGGRLGMNFGRYLGLEGYYLTRSNVNTELERTGLLDGANQPLMDQELDISTYGADLVLNMGTGSIIPFLRTGGGILRFKNAMDEDVKQINFKAGGGIKFGVDRFQAEIFAEDNLFRLNRYELAGDMGVFPEDPESDQVWNNLSFGVGLNFNSADTTARA